MIEEDRPDEDRFFERIAGELESGNVDKVLWTKAIASAGGDEGRTKALYIAWRLERLKRAARDEQEEERLSAERQRRVRIRDRFRAPIANADPRMLDALENGAQFRNLCVRGALEQIDAMVEQNPFLLGVPDYQGNTCLHFAAKENREVVARYLIDVGARPGAMNAEGKTALDVARAAGQSTIACILQAALESDAEPVSYPAIFEQLGVEPSRSELSSAFHQLVAQGYSFTQDAGEVIANLGGVRFRLSRSKFLDFLEERRRKATTPTHGAAVHEDRSPQRFQRIRNHLEQAGYEVAKTNVGWLLKRDGVMFSPKDEELLKFEDFFR